MPLFAELLDKENLGWAATFTLLFGVVSKFAFDVWVKYGVDTATGRKTTIDEYKDLLARTEKTLSDVATTSREREEEFQDSIRKATREHNDCLRKYDQLLVRMEWMESELRREGVNISIWPRAGSDRPSPLTPPPTMRHGTDDYSGAD